MPVPRLAASCLLLVTLAVAQEAIPEGRAALEIPDAVWNRIALPHPFGFSGDEMRNYGGRDYLLRTVENLFRDARRVPREIGRITDDMLALAAAGKIDEILQRCWSLLDMPAGRNFPMPAALAEGVSPSDAYAALLPAPGPPGDDRAAFARLPGAVQRLVVRVCTGATEATRWAGAPPRSPRDSWARPWLDEENDLSATRAHAVFDDLRAFELARAAFASVVFAAHLRAGLDEWHARAPQDLPGGRWEFPTPLGPLWILGSAADVIDSAALSPGTWCVIDLGGNDQWKGSFAATSGTGGAVSLALDLGGDDVWDAGEEAFALGCGCGGIGALVDLSGNDRYVVRESGLGCAWFGTGLLWDLAGNDEYVVKTRWGQGAAHMGVGLLLDSSGDDRYHAQCWSQGCGYWWAVGVLEDRAGNDIYENGKYSLGAGAHFAIGVVVDLAGDDLYNQGVAGVKNQFQGHARDGSIGVAIDGDGNDRYLLKNLCAGCADLASMALFWDRRGDDVYAATMEEGLGDAAPFGSATTYDPLRSFRDDVPAIGIFLDTGGADTYRGDPRGEAGARDAAQWSEHKRPASLGFGLDLGAYR